MATQAIEQAPGSRAGAAAADPKKGKRGVLILAIAGIVAGVAAGLFGVGPMLAKRKARRPRRLRRPKLKIASVTHAIENLVLNPAGSGGTRFLMVTATFELKDGGAEQHHEGPRRRGSRPHPRAARQEDRRGADATSRSARRSRRKCSTSSRRSSRRARPQGVLPAVRDPMTAPRTPQHLAAAVADRHRSDDAGAQLPERPIGHARRRPTSRSTISVARTASRRSVCARSRRCTAAS